MFSITREYKTRIQMAASRQSKKLLNPFRDRNEGVHPPPKKKQAPWCVGGGIIAVVLNTIDSLTPTNAGTKDVGFSPTRQILLAPSAMGAGYCLLCDPESVFRERKKQPYDPRRKSAKIIDGMGGAGGVGGGHWIEGRGRVSTI